MEKVEMELLKRHTHDGIDRQPPETIMVEPRKVNWLVSQGIAKKAGGLKPAPRKDVE